MKDDIKKIKKYIKLVKFVAAAATVAMAIYTLIPKSEKITEVDAADFEASVNRVTEQSAT